LILASASASRQAMLRDAGVGFECRVPSVDEASLKSALQKQGMAPEDIALALAEAKGAAGSRAVPDAFVIGADQILMADGRLYDKAPDKAAARRVLESLRGRAHRLISAVVLTRGGDVLWRHVGSAELRMRAFSDAFLDAYLAGEDEALLHCVGCYRIEGRGAQLFAEIEGDQFTIRGLPLIPLLAALRQNGLLPT
jgi:septum formation protein